MTSIWQARKAGWSVSLRCHRVREGLKSAKPCMGSSAIDLSTLISALGPEVKLADLQTRLVCPICGTNRIEIVVSQPPPADSGAKDAIAPKRRMKPSLTMEDARLGTSREPWVIFVCDQCKRRGEIKRETLVKEFGPDVYYPALLEVFAKSRGCTLANPGASPYDADRMSGNKCKIHYDVERGD